MKNYLVILYSICAITGTLSSCDGNETESNPCPNIVGKWEWKKFVGGFGGTTITPDSLGITKTLIIDDTFFSVLINDTLQTGTTYECVPITNSHFTVYSIKLGTGDTYVPMVHNDTLVLSDVFMGDKDVFWRK